MRTSAVSRFMTASIARLRWLPMAALLVAGAAGAQSDLLSRENVRTFRLTHPCPMTGLTTNPCPGWVVALITPRCAAGTDDPKNLQWLTTAAAASKEDAERRECPLWTPTSGH
jgi:hypothetical protein